MAEPGCTYLDTPCQYPATGTHSPQGPAAALASATVANTEATATLEKMLIEEVTASSRDHSAAFGGQTPASYCQVAAAEVLSGLWQWSVSLCHREMRTPCQNCLLDVMAYLCC